MIQVAGVPAYPNTENRRCDSQFMEFNTLCLILSIAAVVLCAVFFAAGVLYRKKVAEKQIGSAEEEAGASSTKPSRAEKAKSAKCCSKRRKRSINHAANTNRRSRSAARKSPSRSAVCSRRKKPLTKKVNLHEKKEDELAKKIAAIDKKQEEVDSLKRSQMEVLEKISGLTQDEAKAYILKGVEDDVRHETAMKIKEIETQVKEEADQTAREIIATAIQRCAADPCRRKRPSPSYRCPTMK